VRWLVGLVSIALAPTVAFAAKSSNPAFLGVGMGDVRQPNGNVVCEIASITKDSGAEAAGLRPGDQFVAVEAEPIGNCNALVAAIQARESCEVAKIDVRRSGVTTTVTAKLCSRADVLRQRVVGQKLPITSLLSVEDQSTISLSSKGKTTIIGWFDQKNCVGCDQVFAAVDRWARGKSTKASPIAVVGATNSGGKSLQEMAVELKGYQAKLDLPLLIADAQTFSDLAIGDGDRIHFMVIDSRGVVQYVAPVAPDADDKTAVLDEIFASAEQASRKHR
jgi:membrane-associated protease RseP (regulator of RpoE activity)